MKKIILSIIVFSFLFRAITFAQEINLPQPGLTPDSPFYFLKLWKESIQAFFTFGAENKAKQFLYLAEVRLAEYQKMTEKGRNETAEKTLGKYENQLNNALAKIEELKNKGKDIENISEKIKTAAAKHIEILEKNLIKAPEAAKEGLKNAIENSQKVLQKSFKKYSQEAPEEACKNLCGDGVCQEIVCMAIGCPCAETKESCPQDCVENEVEPSNRGQKIIGGDKDEHGCLIAAGYSWCESKNKCLRIWEESCENVKLGPIYCSQEARICPDGTAVGRTGPNCEFTPCPK